MTSQNKNQTLDDSSVLILLSLWMSTWKEWMRFRMSTEDSGGRLRGRPRLRWMDGVNVVLSDRGMTVEAARQYAKDRKEWRALVHM